MFFLDSFLQRATAVIADKNMPIANSAAVGSVKMTSLIVFVGVADAYAKFRNTHSIVVILKQRYKNFLEMF